MTCRFLENLTLASLLAPVSETEFRERYWEQQPLVVDRGDPDYYDDLFTLRDFDDAITRSPDYVKLANAATKKNVSYRPSSAEGMEAVLNDMRSGGTLVLDQLHHREPKLNLLCRALGPEFGHRFQTNLYLTPPNGKGFTPHWDNHDVFILQVVGSKHWKIEKERRLFPEKSESMGDECCTFTKPSRGLPPTRCVGESGVTSSGCSASSAFSSLTRRSYSASEISGSSST